MRLGVGGVVLLAWAYAFAAPVSESAKEIARGHFHAGKTLFAEGRYREALVEFEAARREVPLPAFDYNIAVCYERMDEPEMAIAAWRRYLHAATPAEEPEVRARIDELERVLASRPRVEKPAPSKPPAPPPPLPGRERYRKMRIAGYVLLGVGVAGVAIGAAFAALGDSAANRLTELDRMRGTYDPALDDEYSTDRTLGGVFFGIGVPALATGAALVGAGTVLERRSPALAFQVRF
jgi:tetratricopeptide (TPR) repeat protein